MSYEAMPSEELATILDETTTAGPHCPAEPLGIHVWWLLELCEEAVYECANCGAEGVG